MATPQAETVSFKNWEAYKLGARSTLVNRFYRTQQLKKQAELASLIHLVTSVGYNRQEEATAILWG